MYHIRWPASRYMSFVLDMQDVTGYLFLHGHILQQQSPDSMRAFPGFPPWTKSWSGRSKTSQTDCGVHCVLPLCCHLPLDTKGNVGISCTPYMTSHPGRLMSPGTPPLITHKASVRPTPSQNSLELACCPPRNSVTAIYVQLPFLAICFGNQRCVLLLTHNVNKHGFSVEDQ